MDSSKIYQRLGAAKIAKFQRIRHLVITALALQLMLQLVPKEPARAQYAAGVRALPNPGRRETSESYPVPYASLMRAAAASSAKSGRKGPAEIEEALAIIGGGYRLSAAKISARLKSEMPEIDPNAPVRVLDEVLANIVREGKDEQHMRAALRPILEFLGLGGRVRAVLFKSEVPVIALSPPNGLMISTRALELLSEEELRAIVTHELCHLPLTDVFRAAVDAKDYRMMRVIELFCDACAASIAVARGVDPKLLVSGLRKMWQVLEAELGERDVKGDHPTLGERARLIRKLSSRLLP